MSIVLIVNMSLQNNIFLIMTPSFIGCRHVTVGYRSLFHLSHIIIELTALRELFVVAIVVRNIDLMD